MSDEPETDPHAARRNAVRRAFLFPHYRTRWCPKCKRVCGHIDDVQVTRCRHCAHQRERPPEQEHAELVRQFRKRLRLL